MTRSIAFSLLVSIAFTGLQAQPLNALSAQEKKEGWKLLFNGQNTAGWHKYGAPGTKVGSSWQIDQGALHLNVPTRAGNKAPDGGDLVTDAPISGDFEFKAEWKVDKFTNSGIFFFVQEQPQFKNVYDTGLELQIEDDAILAGVGEDKQQGHRAGDFFNLAVARVREVEPVGGWNKVHFILKKNRLTVSLNGYSIQEHELTSADWKKLVAASKLKDSPMSKGKFSGRIGLQDWGSSVWFRNIKIRQL
ncbi:3-keto-disaccharide hydrolase [Fibrella forsythiae]|uniref:3-keto-disaccharide hydrolase n=1 Tax=Fibrella forsythiae TaxID=2817061 RepID=UPI0035B5C1AE